MENKKVLLLVLAVVIIVAAGVGISAKVSQDQDKFTVRQVKEQVVLYTIYRGNYDKVGPAIGKLFALAGQKGLMPPKGPVSFAYLNNPQMVSSEHWLTEIRIPVSEEALGQAGKLGEMTDVKKLPAMEVAVAVKPEGVADPAPIYDRLMKWRYKNKYIGVEAPIEIFLTNATSGDYTQMKAEIMIPVQKLNLE